MNSDSAQVVHVKDRVPGAVYIGRANGRMGLKASPFANPFKVTTPASRYHAIDQYRWHLERHQELIALARELLTGKTLSCWCRHEGEEPRAFNACHGDVLVQIAKGVDPIFAWNYPREHYCAVCGKITTNGMLWDGEQAGGIIFFCDHHRGKIDTFQWESGVMP